MVHMHVKLNFSQHHKKYDYEIDVEPPITNTKIAYELARVMERDKRKRRLIGKTNRLPDLSLIMYLLRKNQADITTEPHSTTKEEMLYQSKSMTDTEKFYKVGCEYCGGSGIISNPKKQTDTYNTILECPSCKGHGYLYKRVAWRAGKTFNKNLAIDIDNHDEKNLAQVLARCHELFGYRFDVIKTNNGYQLIGTHIYENINDWLYANCLILNPVLKFADMEQYIKDITSFDEETKRSGISLEESAQRFKNSIYCSPIGDIDIMFTYLSIKHKKSTLRISKKLNNKRSELIK